MELTRVHLCTIDCDLPKHGEVALKLCKAFVIILMEVIEQGRLQLTPSTGSLSMVFVRKLNRARIFDYHRPL
jgi:hypothetical protein